MKKETTDMVPLPQGAVRLNKRANTPAIVRGQVGAGGYVPHPCVVKTISLSARG